MSDDHALRLATVYPSSVRRFIIGNFPNRSISGSTTQSLDGDSLMDGPNLFYAIRLDGDFSSVKTRSVPRQVKPYPHLEEVARSQPVFQLKNVRGTLAGFRFPDYTRGLNVPGFHLHFLTEDKRAGGHVLDLELERGELAIDSTSQFHMELPTDPAFLHADLSDDHSAELDKG